MLHIRLTYIYTQKIHKFACSLNIFTNTFMFHKKQEEIHKNISRDPASFLMYCYIKERICTMDICGVCLLCRHTKSPSPLLHLVSWLHFILTFSLNFSVKCASFRVTDLYASFIYLTLRLFNSEGANFAAFVIFEIYDHNNRISLTTSILCLLI